MLQQLHIQNYAIIDELQINFSRNLNVITGETGAGKSILMDALGLILGQRADTTVLQDDKKKCVVEAQFHVGIKNDVTEFFIKNDLDNADAIIVRREISPNGKSRAFINDTPVNIGQLRSLGNLLVDLHQQFDSLELGDEYFQMQIIDAVADNHDFLLKLKVKFSEFIKAKQILETLETAKNAANKELDYNQFLYDELHEIDFKENELESLEEENKLLNNAETIKQNLDLIISKFQSSEEPIFQQLKLISQKLISLQNYHAGIGKLNERIGSSILELQDIVNDLEQINESIFFDEEKIQLINDRMSAGYKLLKKHNVQTTTELLSIKSSLEIKLTDVQHINDDILELQTKVEMHKHESLEIAKKISKNRQAVINSFIENVNRLLTQVGMPNARLKVELNSSELSETGVDSLKFLFDANNSGKFESLQKVASGGELSRLMLSIKSLAAQKLELPTLIFDEIDTGISGEAAMQVGTIMKYLSKAHQLIVISHLPQIAAKGDAHYFVYKQNNGSNIKTYVKLLNNSERIDAIAKMLSGDKPSAAALENAKELILLDS